jgi:hypothetical protein
MPSRTQSQDASSRDFQLLMRDNSSDWFSLEGTASAFSEKDEEQLREGYIRAHNKVFPLEATTSVENIAKSLRAKLEHSALHLPEMLNDGLKRATVSLSSFHRHVLEKAGKDLDDLFLMKTAEENRLNLLIGKRNTEIDAIKERKKAAESCLAEAKKIRSLRYLHFLLPVIGSIIIFARKVTFNNRVNDALNIDASSGIKHAIDRLEAEISDLQKSRETVADHMEKLKKILDCKLMRFSRQEEKLCRYREMLEQLNRLESDLYHAYQIYPSSNAEMTLKEIYSHMRSKKKLPADKVNEMQELLQKFMDSTVRSYSFHIAARHWEARWLLEKRKENEIGQTSDLETTIRQYCMLAPCIVATFNMLPDLFDPNRTRSEYITDLADLLIVDEAGQALPEVAPIFSLARKAVVVGDVRQLEPIWNIKDWPIHDRLLKKEGLYPYRKRMEHDGRSVTSGSIMKMACMKSSYSADPEGGFMLTGHYRCHRDIIDFCNRLSYEGKLIPLKSETKGLFFPMAYVCCHTDSRKSDSSYRNQGEVDKIISWLKEKGSMIEDHYKMPLSRAVAIITAYRPQALALKSAVEKHLGITTAEDDEKDEEKKKNAMVIGTAHSLQGAEKPIVIFSGVCSGGGDDNLLNRKPNLLNVAVSRAKDSFILFGNRNYFFGPDAMNRSNMSPAAILGRYMKEKGKRLFPRNMVLVESGEKASLIQDYLGIDYWVRATFGHIRELKAVENSNAVWSLKEGSSRIIEETTRFLEDANSLVIATDDDREGEAIAWHLLDELKGSLSGNTLIRRMRFHSLDRDEITTALGNAEQGIDMNMAGAAIARAVIDRHISDKLGNVLNTMNGSGESGGFFKTGRVQAAILSLLNEKKKRNGSIPYENNHDSSDVICRPVALTTAYVLKEAADRLRYLPHETMSMMQALYQGRSETILHQEEE